MAVVVSCSKEKPIITTDDDEVAEAGQGSPSNPEPPEDTPAYSTYEAPSNPTGIGSSGLFHPDNVQWDDWLTEECDGMKVPKPGEALGPPIRWKPCEGDVPGCEELEITWEHIQAEPYRAAQVYSMGGGTNLALQLFSPELDDSSAVVHWSFLATAAGANLGVWWISATNEDGACGNVFLGGDGDHLCLAVGRSTAQRATIGFVALLPRSAPMGNPVVAPMNAMANFDCSSELLSGANTAGQIWSYDIANADQQEVLLPDGRTHTVRLFEDRVLALRGGATEAGEFLDAWVWTHDDGAQPLIQPESGFVFDLETDGRDLVWTIAQGEHALEWHDIEVWASRLAFQTRDLSPRLLGEVPNTRASTSYGMARAGHYAVIEGNLAARGEPKELHVLRLSDGQHFLVPKPAGTEPGAPLHIDEDEIWYQAEREKIYATIVRQRIDDLAEME